MSSGHHVGLSPSRSMPTPPRPARTPPVKLTPRSPVVPPPVENAVPPPPPDYYDALTRCGVPRLSIIAPSTTRLTRRYFLAPQSKQGQASEALAKVRRRRSIVGAKIEAKCGAPVIGGNELRTPAKNVFDKLTDSRQYTGSHRTIHRDGPEPPSSGVRWFSPD